MNINLKRVCVPTNATAQSEFLSSRGMFDVKRTVRSTQLNSFGTSWTMWQALHIHGSDTLKVVMARLAEMGSSKTKIDCHRATVTTLWND